MSQLASTRVEPFEKTTRYSAAEATVKWLLSTVSEPDPLTVFCFCALGLAVTFAALAEFADFSASLAEIGGLY
jgi:hypothetical protein